MADTTPTQRQKLTKEIRLDMGEGMIDLYLDPEHIDYAIDSALGRYRQRSNNAMEEAFLFIEAQPDVSVYTLPGEVQEIRALYRRSQGGSAGGAQVDPFSLGWANYIYSIQSPSMLGSGGAGGLATYDFAMQQQELIGRMFGRDIMFTWDTATKRLTLHRRISAPETIACHIYNARPEDVLLMDVYARPWLKDYAIAKCKIIEGGARSKFQSLPGPQGGISLNGDAMITEGKETLERLETEIDKFIDGHDGWPFIVG